jgi:isopenicillin N synthase-like dioxygenase
VEQLRHACHTVGFFVVQIRRPNELVSTSREVLHATREFFQNHPLEEKMTIAYDRSPQFRGYMRLGVENTDGKIDYREQIEYATEYDTNTTTTTKDPEPYEECLKGINLWPTRVQPSLQPIVESYVAQIQTTARSLQQALIMAMMLGSSSSSHPSHENQNDNHQREIKKENHHGSGESSMVSSSTLGHKIDSLSITSNRIAVIVSNTQDEDGSGRTRGHQLFDIDFTR